MGGKHDIAFHTLTHPNIIWKINTNKSQMLRFSKCTRIAWLISVVHRKRPGLWRLLYAQLVLDFLRLRKLPDVPSDQLGYGENIEKTNIIHIFFHMFPGYCLVSYYVQYFCQWQIPFFLLGMKPMHQLWWLLDRVNPTSDVRRAQWSFPSARRHQPKRRRFLSGWFSVPLKVELCWTTTWWRTTHESFLWGPQPWLFQWDKWGQCPLGL